MSFGRMSCTGAMLSYVLGLRIIDLRQIIFFLKKFLAKTPGHRTPRISAMVLMLCTIVVIVALVLIYFAGSGALAGDGKIYITTDRLIYTPGEQASFNIRVDSSGQRLSGDLIIKVYPAASFTDGSAFSRQPLTESVVKSGLTVSDSAAIDYQANVSDLRAGGGGFPLRVSLVQNGIEVLAGSSWLAVVEPATREPLDLVMIWAVGNPPARNPQGVFENNRLLERCRATPLAPDTLLQHLELSRKYPGIKTAYAVEGLLLDELSDMSDGFETTGGAGAGAIEEADSGEVATAIGCLESLRALAKTGNAEMIATPYVFARLPVLAREGWDDGNGQYRIGHDILTEALGLPGVPQGAYVPGLDLTTDSLRYVAATGGEYAVLFGSIRRNVVGPVRPEAQAFRLRDLGGERITSLFSHDGASAALLGDTPDANAFFAELANAYSSDSQDRLVIAASPVSNPSLAREQRDQVYRELDRLSWVSSLSLGEANEKYHPGTQPVTLQRYIDPLAGYVAQTYYQKLSQVHELFEAYRLAVDTDEPELLSMTRNMYTAESAYFLSESASPEQANPGLAFQEAVARQVQEELEGLKVDVKTPLLQQTAGGEATIAIVNQRLYAFNVNLALMGDGIEFPEGGSQPLRLQTGRTEIEVPYRSDSWSHLTVRLESHGLALVEDSAGVRPVTTRVWIVFIVAALALAGGIAYYGFIIRKR